VTELDPTGGVAKGVALAVKQLTLDLRDAHAKIDAAEIAQAKFALEAGKRYGAAMLQLRNLVAENEQRKTATTVLFHESRKSHARVVHLERRERRLRWLVAALKKEIKDNASTWGAVMRENVRLSEELRQRKPRLDLAAGWQRTVSDCGRGWNHAACDRCWLFRCALLKEYARMPVRVLGKAIETCCYCGEETQSGIFVRDDPKEVHPQKGPD